ncbi:MAG: PEP-utilizing enzyme [Patescibacteria group bacterium]
MIKLKKAYTRYRSAFYSYFWYKEESESLRRFGYKLRNFLAVFHDGKFDVYYQETVPREIERVIAKNFQRPRLLEYLKRRITEESKILQPYLAGQKKIGNPRTFRFFYDHALKFWVAMTPFFFIDAPGVRQEIKDQVLSIRLSNEHYSQNIDKIFQKYLKGYFRDKHYIFATPKDVFSKAGRQKVLATLAERQPGMFIYDGEIHRLEELDRFLSKKRISLGREKLGGGQAIKGLATFDFGTVSGTVKVIKNISDFKNFSAGQVLVTEMTSPNFLPLMKKARAIITDEGGLTCHAAIVSRELKIPCIIGVRIATQALQDGERVEMKSGNGIIKIL